MTTATSCEDVYDYRKNISKTESWRKKEIKKGNKR